MKDNQNPKKVKNSLEPNVHLSNAAAICTRRRNRNVLLITLFK
jgi:hypothetical protein